MRNLLIAAVLIVLVLSPVAAIGAIGPVSAQSDPSVSITLEGPATITTGKSVSIEVTMTAPVPVYGVQYRLRSSTPISGSAAKGEFLGQNASSVVLVSQVGDTSVSYGETRTGTERGVTGTGTLSTLSITIPESTSASNLTLSFVETRVANPSGSPVDVTTEGLTLSVVAADDTRTGSPSDSDRTDEDGGDASGSSGGANRTSGSADEGTTKVGGPGIASSPTARWPAVVPDTVRSQFDERERVPVIIVLSSGTAPAQYLTTLTAEGATNVRHNDESNTVRAVVTASTLRLVAARSGVQSVQAVPAPDTTARTEASFTVAMSSAPTPVNTSAAATSSGTPGTTSTTFPVFSPLAALCGGLAVVVLFVRRRIR
jgi:hypothetical protein